MSDRVRPEPAKYKTTNWRRYNQALKARGSKRCVSWNGINANLVRRWIVQSDDSSTEPKSSLNSSSTEGFVQIASRAVCRDPVVASAPCLRLEIRKSDLAISLSLPMGQYSECAALLKLLLS